MLRVAYFFPWVLVACGGSVATSGVGSDAAAASGSGSGASNPCVAAGGVCTNPGDTCSEYLVKSCGASGDSCCAPGASMDSGTGVGTPSEGTTCVAGGGVCTNPGGACSSVLPQLSCGSPEPFCCGPGDGTAGAVQDGGTINVPVAGDTGRGPAGKGPAGGTCAGLGYCVGTDINDAGACPYYGVTTSDCARYCCTRTPPGG